MINCSPPVKSVCHSSATPKLSAKARKSKSNQLMARSATAKLDQLTPVSSPEPNSARQPSSPLCAKMQFDEDSRSAEGESVMCNQVVKNEKPQFSEAADQTAVGQQTANQAAPQSPLSNSSSPSPARHEHKVKGSCSPASRHNAGSPNDVQLAKSINNGNSCSYNSTSQLAAQLNSPNSPTASISSTCSSLTNANATPHGINDILKKSSADAAAANSSSNSNSSASNLIDNHLSVFAAVASAAAINNNSGLASTFTNSSPKLTGTGSQLAHATSALAAAVANRFYFNNNATSGGNSSASQAPAKANQSNTNSNQNSGNSSTTAVGNNANNTSPPRSNAALNNSAALKLNLNDLSSRQFYWQQMVQNQALWQERFSQAVNTVANGASPNGAYSNLNSPLTNSSLLNHCNGQTATPAQANLDSSFNCK